MPQAHTTIREASLQRKAPWLNHCRDNQAPLGKLQQKTRANQDHHPLTMWHFGLRVNFAATVQATSFAGTGSLEALPQPDEQGDPTQTPRLITLPVELHEQILLPAPQLRALQAHEVFSVWFLEVTPSPFLSHLDKLGEKHGYHSYNTCSQKQLFCSRNGKRILCLIFLFR